MTFREKIDKILALNKLDINTVYGLEAFVEASPGAISKYLNKGKEPGPGTIKKIRDGVPGLNPDWWDTGKGEVFLLNGTHPQKPSDNNENDHPGKETFYVDLIENNEEYSLIPKAVFKDYKIVPDKIIDVIINSNANERRSLEEKYSVIIEGYKNRVERLQKENDELRGQIPGQNQ